MLKQELGIEANVVKGKFQELSVLVGDQVVAKKRWFRFPADEAVVMAVKKALTMTPLTDSPTRMAAGEVDG